MNRETASKFRELDASTHRYVERNQFNRDSAGYRAGIGAVREVINAHTQDRVAATVCPHGCCVVVLSDSIIGLEPVLNRLHQAREDLLRLRKVVSTELNCCGLSRDELFEYYRAVTDMIGETVIQSLYSRNSG